MKELRQIPLDMIQPPSKEMRSVITREKLEELAESIKKYGVINPITVKPTPTGYEIIAGHRRFLASQMARRVDIPAIVVDKVGKYGDAITLEENIQREDVNPIDIGRYLAKLMESENLTVQELSSRLNKTPQWVNMHLRLLNLDEMSKAAVEAGQLSYAAALELDKIDDPAHKETLIRAAITGGATVRTVKNWVQSYLQQKEFREKVASGEYSSPDTIPVHPLKTKCYLCGRYVDSNQVISAQICSDCWPVMEQLKKIAIENNLINTGGEDEKEK